MSRHIGYDNPLLLTLWRSLVSEPQILRQFRINMVKNGTHSTLDSHSTVRLNWGKTLSDLSSVTRKSCEAIYTLKGSPKEDAVRFIIWRFLHGTNPCSAGSTWLSCCYLRGPKQDWAGRTKTSRGKQSWFPSPESGFATWNRDSLWKLSSLVSLCGLFLSWVSHLVLSYLFATVQGAVGRATGPLSYWLVLLPPLPRVTCFYEGLWGHTSLLVAWWGPPCKPNQILRRDLEVQLCISLAFVLFLLFTLVAGRPDHPLHPLTTPLLNPGFNDVLESGV